MPVLYENFHHGTITDNPLASVVTTVHSADFVDLPVVAAPNTILLVLDPLGVGGQPEIIQVTGHVALSNTVTAVRGQQTTLNGGPAREHPTGTAWRWTWTAADAVAAIMATGDTMTGPLILSGDPTADSHAANKNYVDDRDALRLLLTGGTVTGQISGITPTGAAHLTRKDYVDTNFVRVTADNLNIGSAGTVGHYVRVGGDPAGQQAGAQVRADGALQSRLEDPSGITSANVYLSRAGAVVADPGGIYISFNRASSHTVEGVNVGSVRVNAGASGVDYNTSSDYRLKDDLGPVVDAVNRMLQLAPKHIRWKASGYEQDSFIAHEVAEVVPNAVSGEKDAVTTEGQIDPQQLAPTALIPLLVAAVQDLAARVMTLEEA